MRHRTLTSVCRAKLEEPRLKWNEAMETLMNTLKIRCGDGCHWNGTVEGYDAHLRDCLGRQLQIARSSLEGKDAENKQLKREKAGLLD